MVDLLLLCEDWERPGGGIKHAFFCQCCRSPLWVEWVMLSHFWQVQALKW